ncbi:MAG: hypothetical protein QOH44_9, partial [Actinomycetota bacterium]|nr:hypothetical protein [Actinomycetota bacterium]
MIQNETSHLRKTTTRRRPLDVQHRANGAHGLARDGDRRHPGQRTECLESRWHIFERVGVKRARTSVVPGVQCGKQLTQFGAATLTKYEPIGAHPQRLAHETLEPERACTLEIRLAGFEGKVVRVPNAQLGDILDCDDPFVWRCAREQRREKRRLAAATRSRDEKIRALHDEGVDRPAGYRGEETVFFEKVERRKFNTRQSHREESPRGRNRGKHGVDADAVFESCINTRSRLVDVPAAERHQPHGELPKFGLIQPNRGNTLEPDATIHPRAVAAVDEDVGDAGICDQFGQLPKLRWIVAVTISADRHGDLARDLVIRRGARPARNKTHQRRSTHHRNFIHAPKLGRAASRQPKAPGIVDKPTVPPARGTGHDSNPTNGTRTNLPNPNTRLPPCDASAPVRTGAVASHGGRRGLGLG